MINPVEYLTNTLFPPKCILCGTVLNREETDFCRQCRATAPEHPQGKLKLQFIDSAAVVWYYKGSVRKVCTASSSTERANWRNLLAE